jgi:hypothetical protein
VAALAAVVALFLLFAGGDDEQASSGATPPQSSQGTTEGQSPDSRTTRPRSPGGTSGRQARREPLTPAFEPIVVRGGKPVGGVRRLEYESRERVRFSVRSDAADEVHVHGFDIEKAVPAGGTARFRFVADLEGVFEIELHGRGVKIGELRIKP